MSDWTVSGWIWVGVTFVGLIVIQILHERQVRRAYLVALDHVDEEAARAKRVTGAEPSVTAIVSRLRAEARK